MGPMERLRAWARWPVDVRPPERKESGFAGGSLVFAGGETAGASWSERGYRPLSREGFMRNPVAYRSVRLVAESVAAVPLLLYDGVREVEDHAMLRLLRRPNGAQDGVAFLEAVCGHLLIGGSAHLEATLLDGEPRMLHANFFFLDQEEGQARSSTKYVPLK